MYLVTFKHRKLMNFLNDPSKIKDPQSEALLENMTSCSDAVPLDID